MSSAAHVITLFLKPLPDVARDRALISPGLWRMRADYVEYLA